MLQEFDDYVRQYDLDNVDIRSKYNHSLRVMKLMVKYAQLLHFSEEDIELCRIVGLLHDIGRFEQLKVYHTYVDHKSVDHADYSVFQLFEKKEIRLFCTKEEWYPIISFAIANHNKISLPPCDDERCLRIARLLRDVDKMDIIYTIGVLQELKHRAKEMEISPKVKECVFQHRTIDTKLAENYNDRLIIQLAFVFDIYYDVVLQEYKIYLDSYYATVFADYPVKDVYDEITRYMEERIEEYEGNRNKV